MGGINFLIINSSNKYQNTPSVVIKLIDPQICLTLNSKDIYG